jgi:hypothetical protein
MLVLIYQHSLILPLPIFTKVILFSFFTLFFNIVEGRGWKRIVPVPTPPSAAPSPHLLLSPAQAADCQYLDKMINSNNSYPLLLSLPLPFPFSAIIYIRLASIHDDIYHFHFMYCYHSMCLLYYLTDVHIPVRPTT